MPRVMVRFARSLRLLFQLTSAVRGTVTSSTASMAGHWPHSVTSQMGGAGFGRPQGNYYVTYGVLNGLSHFIFVIIFVQTF